MSHIFPPYFIVIPILLKHNSYFKSRSISRLKILGFLEMLLSRSWFYILSKIPLVWQCNTTFDSVRLKSFWLSSLPSGLATSWKSLTYSWSWCEGVDLISNKIQRLKISKRRLSWLPDENINWTLISYNNK